MIFRWLTDRDDEDDDPTFRNYNRADPWAAGRNRDRYLDPEPPERPEGVRFHNIDRDDPFGSKNARQVPAPRPVRDQAGGIFWDEHDPDVVWQEPRRSVTFQQADAATLNALMAPDPPPPPKHWSDWRWNGGPGRYEAFRWPEDGAPTQDLRYLEDAKEEARKAREERERGFKIVEPEIDPRAVRQQELEQRYAPPWPTVEPSVIDVAVTEYATQDGSIGGEINLTHYGYASADYGQTATWKPMSGERDWPTELAALEAPDHDAPEPEDPADDDAPEDGADAEDNERAGIGGMLWG